MRGKSPKPLIGDKYGWWMVQYTVNCWRPNTGTKIYVLERLAN